MLKHKIARCPDCGGKISFKKFILLNNFSETNCKNCNARIEISNRDTNAILAGISGCLSATAIVLGAYMGERNLNSWIVGLGAGLAFSGLLLLLICLYAYNHAVLNRIYRT